MSLAGLRPPLVPWPLCKPRLPPCFDPTARHHATRSTALVPTLSAAAVTVRAPLGSCGAAQPRRSAPIAAIAAIAAATAFAFAAASRGGVRRQGGGVAAARLEQARGDEDGERGLRVDDNAAQVGRREAGQTVVALDTPLELRHGHLG